ncbi:MAG: sel1 repeat family protein [Proteobacteria bacterium]|nr:sel1 repeat family protein [Pseudomonadota bacterium]
MILRKSVLIFGFLFLSMGATSLAHADFNRGWEAYDRGDYETALKEWLIDANKGNPAAQSMLGLMYANGWGVPENDAEAVRWYRLAADQGYVKAQYNLGYMYANGEGVPENDAEAVRWYRLAAGQGYAAAQFTLGVMYANGLGVPENFITAYMWWNLAAAQGVEVAQDNKEFLRVKMTSEQIAEAQRLSTEWLKEHQ